MGVGTMMLALMLTGIVLLILTVVCLIIAELCVRRLGEGVEEETVQATDVERARVLLREVLDDREWRQLTRHGYVDVTSPQDAQRMYRIPEYPGLVAVYEQGTPICALCVQPVEPLPSADLVIMHKLMILGDENGYLDIARRHVAVGPALRRPFARRKR